MAVVMVPIFQSIPHSTTWLAMSGKTTPQYKSVNTSQSTIISAFKCNPSAFKTLKQKFKEKSWLALADDKDEEGLVILVLNRIELDVGDFNKLNDMLKGIEGMDLIVKQLKGVSITYWYLLASGDMWGRQAREEGKEIPSIDKIRLE